ncbi:aqualysin-1-like [Patiria miniata]|uniref:Peptidase S8/S53 domain-containing protein n=1 Tax=Patiria miniata TaxID=46514 RepID=A0A914BSE7_PATMI|nr:aqualysin-1-like [Patiria miniata]
MKFLLLCLCVAVANAGLAPLITSNSRTVPDSWIIKVKDVKQIARIEKEIKDILEVMRAGVPTVETYEQVLPGLALKIPACALNVVRGIESIEYIHEDQIGAIYGSQSGATWGIDRIDSRTGTNGVFNYNDNALGQGANIFIVDTGIRTTHIAFGGRASTIYGANVDDHGHGTHCAGTAGGDVYGIARKANVYSVKVCNSWGSCPLSTVQAGLNAIVNQFGTGNGKGVVSMALGFSKNSQMDAMVNDMLNKGYTVSVVAGNDNSNACNVSPANVPGALTTAASTSSDSRSYASNYGSCVDLFAPGYNIVSASYSSDTGSLTMSGSSMACAHVTGACAVYLGSNPGSSPSTVHSAIVNAATNGVISDAQGSPNKLLYVAP